MNNKQKTTYLSVVEFAKRWGSVSHDTVLRMIQQNKIKASKKNPLARNSPYMIPETELKKVQNAKHN